METTLSDTIRRKISESNISYGFIEINLIGTLGSDTFDSLAPSKGDKISHYSLITISEKLTALRALIDIIEEKARKLDDQLEEFQLEISDLRELIPSEVEVS